MNALAQEIAAQIEAQGPMGVDRFMALALAHPRYGYYMTRDPLGAGGDFITAPEISQMFGELLGLALAIYWQQTGSPKRVHLVELGPGRGTLMVDALRAAKAVPEFFEALQVHLVETSPVLRKIQAKALKSSGKKPFWHETLEGVPHNAPLFVLANEFFDALPVRQFERRGSLWHERLVGLGEAGFRLGLNPQGIEGPDLSAPEGAVFETSPASLAVIGVLSQRLVAQGGLAYVIDYGHARPGFGDTVQAMQGHHFVSPFEALGEVDITAHVDFSALGGAALRHGAQVWPILTQGRFLEALGIRHRAEILKRKAEDPAQIDAAVMRLTAMDVRAMGALFKVMAITAPGGAAPPGFEGL